MKRTSRLTLFVSTLATALVLTVACSSGSTSDTGGPGDTTAPTSSGDPIVVGLDTALSGAIGELGEQNARGIQMHFDEVNAAGGLLGRPLELVTRDNAADPALATTNTRNLILDEEVVALFGPVSSATAVSQSVVVTEFEIPVVNTIANDIALSTTEFSPWVFQFVPNSHMEAVSIAEYVAASRAGGDQVKVATIAPDYNQGRTTVAEFAERISARGVGEVVNSQFPALGTTDFGAEITALLAAEPDIVFAVISGNDLVTWTGQAESYGLFESVEVIAPWGWNLLEVLGDEIPNGVSTYARAPFFAIENPGVQDFAQRYFDKFGEWPTDWALLGYSGAQQWVQAVEAAGSVESAAIRDSLETITAETLLGSLGFRDCDHQAPLPSYVGPLSDDLDPDYGFKTFTEATVVSADDTMFTCEQASAGR